VIGSFARASPRRTLACVAGYPVANDVSAGFPASAAST
jgi:hypothetical protein